MKSVTWRMFSVKMVLTSFVAVFIMPWLFTVPSFAQDADPAQGDAPTETQADAEPAFPAGLDDPNIKFEEFQLRLIPLTKDELSALASRWQDIVREQTDAVVEKTIAAQGQPGGTTQLDADSITALTEERNLGFQRYSAVVSNLEKKGGDEAEVADYRAYRSAIIVDEKQQADFRTLATQAVAWTTSWDGGLKTVLDVSVFIGSLLGLLLVARIVRGYMRRIFKRVPNLSKLLQGFLAMLVYWITIAIGLMIVLSALGFDVTPIFALVGGASFILAFAMQDTLGNLAAGLMIMMNRPFDEGDYVSAGGTAGTVKSVSIVSTTITTPDNQVIVIPNSMVWGDVITNATASALRRVDLLFGIDYGDDADKAMQIILDLSSADPRVLGDPEPWVRVTNLGDSSVDLTARLWCNAADYWDIKFDMTKAVKEAFDQNGVSIPYPHSVEIHKSA